MVKCASFFLFLPLWKIVKKINIHNICGESKSYVQGKRGQKDTHTLNFLFLFFKYIKNKTYIYNIYF